MKSETIARLASYAAPLVYPEGLPGSIFRDRRNRPMALICGAMACHGSQDPWGVPHTLKSRMGLEVLRPAEIHAQSRADIANALKGLHRSPQAMSGWLRAACGLILADFCGDAAWLWNNGNGITAPRLMARLIAFPGLGPAKAVVLMKALNRDWGVKITEWEGIQPAPTPAMKRMAFRMGWDGGLTLNDPQKILDIYDGVRVLANEVCTGKPACERCPMDDSCPKNGMSDD